MRRISITACTARWLLMASMTLYAVPNAIATIVNFDDDLGAGPNTYSGPGGGNYWNGPDPNGTDEPDPYGGPLPVVVGSFQSGGVRFANQYNTNYGSWGGFAYSNTTDTTTAGYSNQFSAYAGSGYGGSANYAVGSGYVDNLNPSDVSELQQLPYFDLPSGTHIQNAYVTNTTYAALSMLNGDGPGGFAKKFGCTWNDTTKSWVDTNSPDWFELTVFGTDATGNVLRNNAGDPLAVDFYLADYRNLNSTPDYVISQWTFLDLSPLANASRLYFNLTSSDVGECGMNTPGSFAIDNISYTAVPEPSTFVLLCGAGIAWAVWGYRRRVHC